MTHQTDVNIILPVGGDGETHETVTKYAGHNENYKNGQDPVVCYGCGWFGDGECFVLCTEVWVGEVG